MWALYAPYGRTDAPGLERLLAADIAVTSAGHPGAGWACRLRSSWSSWETMACPAGTDLALARVEAARRTLAGTA